jgi:hypothetical protein
MTALRGSRLIIVPAKTGALEGAVSRQLMSALGHKQTCAPQKAMSALPPIATLIAYFHEGGSVARLQLRTEFAQEAKSYRWV